AARVLRRGAGRPRLRPRRVGCRTGARPAAVVGDGVRQRRLHPDRRVRGAVPDPDHLATGDPQARRRMTTSLRTARGRSRWVAVAALVLFAAAALTVPGWAGEYWTRVFTGVAMWAGLALSWNVIGGYAGYISFGQVAFFGIGSYTTAILMQPEHGWNFFLTLPVGAALAVLLAVVVGWPALRLRGAYFAIATWALAEAMLQVANAVGFTGGSSGLSITAVATDTFFYYMMLGTAVVAYAVCY